MMFPRLFHGRSQPSAPAACGSLRRRGPPRTGTGAGCAPPGSRVGGHRDDLSREYPSGNTRGFESKSLENHGFESSDTGNLKELCKHQGWVNTSKTQGVWLYSYVLLVSDPNLLMVSTCRGECPIFSKFGWLNQSFCLPISILVAQIPTLVNLIVNL